MSKETDLGLKREVWVYPLPVLAPWGWLVEAGLDRYARLLKRSTMSTRGVQRFVMGRDGWDELTRIIRWR